jgi:hypothetical protein
MALRTVQRSREMGPGSNGLQGKQKCGGSSNGLSRSLRALRGGSSGLSMAVQWHSEGATALSGEGCGGEERERDGTNESFA